VNNTLKIFPINKNFFPREVLACWYGKRNVKVRENIKYLFYNSLLPFRFYLRFPGNKLTYNFLIFLEYSSKKQGV